MEDYWKSSFAVTKTESREHNTVLPKQLHDNTITWKEKNENHATDSIFRLDVSNIAMIMNHFMYYG